MEDLNNLLNGGEVPNLFPADERLQARPPQRHTRKKMVGLKSAQTLNT